MMNAERLRALTCECHLNHCGGRARPAPAVTTMET
jgi:hypothetical protein